MTPSIAEQIAAVQRAIQCYETGAAHYPETAHVAPRLKAAATTLSQYRVAMAVVEALKRLRECEAIGQKYNAAPRDVAKMLFAKDELDEALAALDAAETETAPVG